MVGLAKERRISRVRRLLPHIAVLGDKPDPVLRNVAADQRMTSIDREERQAGVVRKKLAVALPRTLKRLTDQRPPRAAAIRRRESRWRSFRDLEAEQLHTMRPPSL